MDFRRKMIPLPLSEVKLTDRFWTRRQKALIEAGLESQYQQIVQTERLENFHRAARGESGTYVGKIFNDSDVYKWLEACAYALVIHPQSEIKDRVNECVQAIVAAQQSDGYINTFLQVNHPHLKWRNLNAMHEMYCGGHLIEAGVALDQATGDRRLLDVAIRFADHVADSFGPSRRKGYCGHEEIEYALIRLAEHTAQPKYRELSQWMVLQRGSRPSPFEAELPDKEAMKLSPHSHDFLTREGVYSGEYLQDHAPVEEHSDVVGHAVRAMYLYMAAAEFASEHPKMIGALERAWQNLTERRMYITGGIGPSGDNEGFTFDYDLPNRSAYAETCAAVGLAFWGRQMLEHSGDGAYADIVERSLFNGSISGVSLDGTLYFYTNPLESRGEHKRVPWFGCACCPPNIARLILSAPNYLLSASDQDDPGVWIHIPASLEADLRLAGTQCNLQIEADYPWSGDFTVAVNPDVPLEFAVRIRIPAWCDDFSLDQPDDWPEAEFEEGYAVLRRTWIAGDSLKVHMEMKPKWVGAHPNVLDDLERAALTMGPVVYCLEERDFGAAPAQFRANLGEEVESGGPVPELEDAPSLLVRGDVASPNEADSLYSDFAPVERKPSSARFIPYFTWCNRGPNGMAIWQRTVE